LSIFRELKTTRADNWRKILRKGSVFHFLSFALNWTAKFVNSVKMKDKQKEYSQRGRDEREREDNQARARKSRKSRSRSRSGSKERRKSRSRSRSREKERKFGSKRYSYFEMQKDPQKYEIFLQE
jgi:hypothetical protein